MYSGMAKGTSRGEVTSNSKKINPVALAIVELCKSEDIRQAGISQKIPQKILLNNFFLRNPAANF